MCYYKTINIKITKIFHRGKLKKRKGKECADKLASDQRFKRQQRKEPSYVKYFAVAIKAILLYLNLVYIRVGSLQIH